ncbi:PPC domain-containing protein [Singulisphaera sp. PoT]|uniref:PPC domain-containing protein n=1 Tax=Singulisphaera sp. PoT TaxID=3411797 RepID=UPI003BF585DE
MLMLRPRHACPLGVLLAILLEASAVAKPPSLEHLFPAGAQRGQSVAVTATGSFDRWPPLVWTDGEGADLVVTPEKDKGKLTIKVAPDAKVGIHWIRIHDEEGTTDLRPFVVGLLPEAVEAGSLSIADPPHVTINGTLAKKGESDQYSVHLLKGQTLLATVDANQGLKSPMDSVLQVASAEGFVLAQNDDEHGMDPQIAFVAPEDGNYLVRIFTFPSVPNSTIAFAGNAAYIYRLTLTTRGFVDFPYPMAIAGDAGATVEAFGWNVPESARKLPITFKADEPVGTVIHPELGNAIEVRRASGRSELEHEPNDLEHPQTIVVPSMISGRLEQAKDRDVFAFPAKKGEALTFRLEARVLDSPLDPVLTIVDATGKTLVEADDARRNRNPELLFSAPEDGTYRLIVRDLSDHGGERYVYGIEATATVPDFQLSVGTEWFTVENGKTLSLPVTIERKNGFNRPIEIRLEGFPAGVEATSVRSEPEGDSSKAVTLTLTSKGTAGSAPIQVVGKAVGGPKVERLAQLPAPGRLALPAWLTVLKPGTVATPVETKAKK